MRTMLAALVLLAACASAPEPEATHTPLYSAEAVRADFDALYDGLQRSHYDLYANTTRASYDAAFARMRAEIHAPMSALDVQVFFQRFAALSHVAHARLDFPSDVYRAYREAGGLGFPLSTRADNGRIFVTQDLSGAGQTQPSDEVLSLNGLPTPALITRLRQHISADTDALAYAQLDQLFAGLLWLEFGEVEQFEMTLRRADGAEARVTIPARSRADMRAFAEAAAPVLELDPTERVARMMPNRVAYLRPGIFLNYPSENLYDTTAFHAFIDEAFTRFMAEGATTLLIDLRDNPGGDNSFSDHMIAWFAREPFRFTSDFRIRVSAQTRASNAARLTEATDSISAQLATLYEGTRDGEVVSFSIPIVQPRSGARFSGRVFVLVNRRSYSNAVSVAAIIQDYQFGTVIGEPTADLATTFGAMEQLTLPNTSLTVGYPKALIIRPNGDTRVAGVAPTIIINTPLVEGVEDPVLLQALARIAAP